MQKSEEKTWESVLKEIADSKKTAQIGLATEIIRTERAKSQAKNFSVVCLSIVTIVLGLLLFLNKKR